MSSPVRNLAVCCGTIWRRREKPQYRCTTTNHHVHKSPKDILDRIWQTQFPSCCTQNLELFTATSPFSNHQPTTVPVWAQNSSLQTRLHMTFTSENYWGVNLLTYLPVVQWLSAGLTPAKSVSIHCVTCKNPFSALTLLAGWQEGHPTCKKTGCWFVGGDNLAGALSIL